MDSFGAETMSHSNKEKIDLAWFAGLFEGEGSLVVCLGRRKGGFHFGCQASFVNTDRCIIDEVCRISQHFNISYHELWHKDKKYSHWKEKGEIFWYGQAKMIQLCKLILPYMRGEKSKRAKLLIEYCENRKRQRNRSYHAKHDMSALLKIVNSEEQKRRVLEWDLMERTKHAC
jgi:hypothetical protein